MHKLYELKQMLCDELEEYGSKDKLDVGGLEIVDKLAHAVKNLDKIIESYEEEEYSMEGRSYAQGGNMGGQNYRGSYARGRRNAKRDSMGRYSRNRYPREGYSMAAEDVIEEVRGMMQDAPDDRTRREYEKIIQKIEQM